MQQQKPSEDMTKGKALNLTGHLSSALAFLTEPFLCYGFGKNYCRDSLFGGLIAMGCILVLFPKHESVITSYAILWSLMVCLRIILAHYNHHFGRRVNTKYCGTPVISLVFPFWLHFLRRVINPLLTFAAGVVADDRALALLFKSSAIGQFVMYTLIYMISQADDDARSDATNWR